MSHSVEKISLKSPSPGVRRFLTVHKFFGRKKGPKVYLQAALHADEWPGLLTLQHLISELIELDNNNEIAGEIIIVPYANPIGMDQKINGVVLGRQSFSAEGNFNRNWPDFSDIAISAYETTKGLEASVNKVDVVKKALKEAVSELPTQTALNQLKATLLHLSIDADIVLDVHCDDEALVHLYSNYRHKKEVEVLARYLKSPVVLLEDEPGGSPFDAAHIRPWIALEDTDIGHDCFSATIELRGFTDVNDSLAKNDANGILRYLSHINVISAVFSEPDDIPIQVSDLAAVDSVVAPVSGVLCFNVSLGDKVEKNQKIAEIVDVEAGDPLKGRTAIYSRTNGILFATVIGKLVSEGENVAKIAGNEVLLNETGGGLLTL